MNTTTSETDYIYKDADAQGFGYEYRSLDEALCELVMGFYNCDQDKEQTTNPLMIKRSSRDGDVIQLAVPIVVSFPNPTRRVLLNPGRDCNPFFHVFESLWMLAGLETLEPLTYYVKDFGRYSDDRKTLNGAYGYRWRKHFGFDQVLSICEELKQNPDSRRCVLQMWDATNWITPEGQLGKRDLHKSMGGDSKDVPCNTHAYFLVNNGKLDMTVCNRSNDLIWGMLGANAVHFSFLQEYMARLINVPVGRYNQVTNNLHVYTSRWKPESYLRHGEYYVGINDKIYERGNTVALDVTQQECERFVNTPPEDRGSFDSGGSRFINEVAGPMCKAHYLYKQREFIKAIDATNQIKDDPWKLAASEWLLRREAVRVT